MSRPLNAFLMTVLLSAAQGLAGQYRPSCRSPATTMPYMMSLVTGSVRASRALWRRLLQSDRKLWMILAKLPSQSGRTWRDRVAGGPWDTHELAVHRNAPDILRVSAGDGYFESDDAGATWRSPSTGLEVGYLRSVAIDPGQPDVVVVSASSGPYTAYVAGRSDGRLYRRLTRERWERVRDGWPEPPSTIAPLLCADAKAGELWAADERGVHRSDDSGKSWRRVVGYATSPQHLRGLALLQ
jgi:hypothetical protein